MSYPSWNSSELWFKSACNKELRAAEKRLLGKILIELSNDKNAKQIFDETCSRLQQTNNLTELGLLHELGQDPRWETLIEVLVQGLKPASDPHYDTSRWIVRKMNSTFSWFRRQEHLGKAATNIAATVAATAVSIPVALKIATDRNHNLDFTIPMSVQAKADQKETQIPISFQPSITPVNLGPVPLQIQFDPNIGLPQDGLKVPVNFLVAEGSSVGSSKRLIGQDCNSCADQGQISALASRVDDLNKNVAELNASIDGINKEETELMSTNSDLLKWKDQDSRRLQTTTLTIPQNHSRQIELPVLNLEGKWENCSIELVAEKITKAAPLRVRYGTCDKKQPEILSMRQPRDFTAGKTRWTLTLNSIQAPVAGSHYANIDLLGITRP